MKAEIINLPEVNPTEFGIETNKAMELVGNLPQIVSERQFLEARFNEVIKLDIDDPRASKEARALRFEIRDNRTKKIGVWHKTTKEVFLRAGQFIDAVKRKEEAVNLSMEEVLEKIEKHAEIKEQQRKEELRQARAKELEIYSEFVPFGIDLCSLPDDEYQKVFNGSKLQYDAKVDADKKAEAERLEAERLAEEKRLAEAKAEAERIEAQRVENERLKKEAEAREKEIQAERKKAQEAEAERQRLAKIEADKQAKIQAEKDAEIEKERQARIKLENEKKAKEEARLKAESDAKKEAEKLAKAPIRKQLSTWVDSFDLPKTNIDNETSKDIIAKFVSFKKWAQSEIIKL